MVVPSHFQVIESLVILLLVGATFYFFLNLRSRSAPEPIKIKGQTSTPGLLYFSLMLLALAKTHVFGYKNDLVCMFCFGWRDGNRHQLNQKSILLRRAIVLQ